MKAESPGSRSRDTLRFSTAVATAVHHGAIIFPCRPDEDAHALAARAGAIVAAHPPVIPGAPESSGPAYSLSPLTYVGVAPGTRIVLPSPNGATCVRYGASVPHLFTGALVNAGAVAAAVSRVFETSTLQVTVVACGERWLPPSADGPLRLAIEDGLGAGAILALLASRGHSLSPEARVWGAAFRDASNDLAALLWDCGSGRELRDKGYAEDVRHASRLDLYDSVPAFQQGRLDRQES